MMMLNPYLIYSYKLNNTPIKGVALGTNTTDKGEESLDEGAFNLPISVQSIQFEMKGTLEVEVKDRKGNTENFTYLIIFDNVSKSSVYGWYEHNLRVIEYTDKLNDYFVDTLISTYPKQSESSQAPRIITKNDYIGWYAESETLVQNNAYRTVMPYIDVREYTTKDINGNITYPRINEMIDYVNIETDDIDATVDVQQTKAFLMIDNNLSSKQIITDADVVFSNVTEGIHTIQYGLKNVPMLTEDPISTFYPIGDVVMYEFTIQVRNYTKLSLYDVINKLRNIKPFETQEYHATTRIFDIDDSEVVNGYTLKEVLEKTPSPQFFIKEATMFQVISGIFKYINSIPRLLHNGDFVDKLIRDDFNEIVGEFNLFGMYDFDSSQDTQLYATRGISPLQRALPNNLDQPNMETPANNFFKTIRATDVQLTMNSNQWYIPLERELYALNKLEVIVPITIQINQFSQDNDGTSPIVEDLGTIVNPVIDMTERTIDKREWNLKDNELYFPSIDYLEYFDKFVGSRNNKSGNIYFEQGDDGLRVADYFGDVVKEDLLSNAINEAIHDKFSFEYRPNYFTINLLGRDTAFPRMVQQILYDTNFSVRDLKFNIEYITLQDFNVVQNREDTRVINRFSEMSLKQSDKQINVELASRKSYGELQRGALPNQSFNKIHYYLDDILPLFTIDEDGYVITQRSITFYNTYIDVLYTATKDHNRLQEFIGVNQEYRPFEIPTSNKVYDRKEYYNDIVFIKPYDTLLVTTKNLLTPKFYEQLVANLQNDKTKKKSTFALVWTDGFNRQYGEIEEPRLLIVPINATGVKQTIMLSVGFIDNQLVANALETLTVGIADVTYNKAIKYTDFTGKFEDIWVAFFNDIEDISIILDKDTYDYDDYPLTPMIDTLSSSDLDDMLDNSLINNGLLYGTPSTTHGGFNPFKFYKDSSENATIQYGASIQSYFYGQFIVGQRFTSFNSIVNNLLDDLYLYTYENNTKYGIFNDQLIKSMGSATKTLLSNDNVTITAYSKGINNHGITVEIDNTLLIGKTSWAIGDNDGNLYLACNEPINKFDFEGTHLDYRITEIGKTPIVSISYQETMAFTVVTSFSATIEIGDTNQESFGSLDIITSFNVVADKGDENTNTLEVTITPSFTYGLSSGSTSQDNLMFVIEPIFVATVQNVALITETPTVGAPTCYREDGVNYVQVNVRNNDTLSAVIKNGTTTLTTLAPNQQASLIVASGISTPYNYNISITAQASGKDVSSTVTRSGTINACLGF